MSTFVEATLGSSAVLLLAVMAAALLKSRPAALRHWVLAVAVTCAWGTPFLSRVVPGWLAAPWHASAAWEAPATRGAQTRVSTTSPPEDTAVSIASIVSASAGRPKTRSGATIALTLWLAGCLSSGLVLLIGLGRLRWLAAQSREVDRGPWFEIGNSLCSAFQIRSPVKLLQSDHPSLLVTWGWRRPKIMLPSAAEEWTRDRIRIVLAHELAHIARGDWVAQLAAETLRSIFWFNPLLWVTCRCLRVESELACDDEVLAKGVEGHVYAAHLLALARSLNPGRRPWVPAPAMARPSSLEGRVRAMLSTVTNRRPVSLPARAVTVVALLTLTILASGLFAQARFYSFTGTAFDPTNRVLPGAKIVLTNTANNAKYEVPTDGTGKFEFVGLPPGQYKLETNLMGFASLDEAIRITGNTQRDLKLKVGSLQETLTITGNSGSASTPSGPAAPAEIAAAEKRLEASRRFKELAEQARAKCAAGASSPQGGNILPPAKLLDVKPVYPEHLRLAKVGGVVQMDAVIGTDGRVRDVPTVKGPHPELESAAVDAVRQWQFSATLLNCEPIAVNMTVTVRFAPQQ